MNSQNGFGLASNGLIFYSSGGFTFKNGTLTTTLYSVDSVGSMSTNGTIYPGGGLNTTGTVTANSFVENAVTLSSKYATITSLGNYVLKAGDTMTGALTVNGNITASGTSIISANSFTEGGVALSSKYLTSASSDTTYLRLNGANNMMENLTVKKNIF